jgi:hypothetical protein
VSTDYSFTHTISGDELWSTERKIAPAIESSLARTAIDADQLYLDDLAAQIEVSRVREIADRLNIDYFTSTWTRTCDGEVQVLFMGLPDKTHVHRFKRTLRALTKRR